jgi:hypothetical protein
MLELMNARLIEENDSVLIVVYAVNQKGRSVGVVIRDLELGATVKLDRGEFAELGSLLLQKLLKLSFSNSIQQIGQLSPALTTQRHTSLALFSLFYAYLRSSHSKSSPFVGRASRQRTQGRQRQQLSTRNKMERQN